jgi:hypothetical protein
MTYVITMSARSVPTITATIGARPVKMPLDDEAMLPIKSLGKLMMFMTRGAKTPPT